MRLPVLFIGLFFACTVGATDSIYHDHWIDLNKNGREDAYENPTLPVAKRVNDLLKRMTLDEKIGQLWQASYDSDPIRLYGKQVSRGAVGSFLDGSALIETPLMRNQLQHIAVEHSRLGIPLILGHDVIHGFRTVFPIPLAQACAWDPQLFERTETVAAREAAAAGIDWVFAPMADLARDPRWGRIAEGFGEDPWLGSLYTAACVRGFQGTNVADPDRVVACLKHYVGYGAAEGGRDYNTTEISEYTLRNFYLPQFKAGVDAGALTVMSAFNCLSGVPASDNRHTLTEILRDEWKFPGFVVSDYNAVHELVEHGVAADDTEAARLALTAGVDMEMVSTTYADTLKRQVEQGLISRKVVDQAVRRVLTVKFEKGLFDQPYTDESRYLTAYLNPDAISLAREAAARSCVLLKNDNVLPLSNQVKNVALIGPLAEYADEQVGPWFSRAHANDIISLATGIREKLAADAKVSVERGCAITENGKALRKLGDFSYLEEPPTGSNEIASAVAAAQSADVVILALGEPRDWSGEDGSRSSLDLPGRQEELFDAVVATGKPVIVVLFNGHPLAIPHIQEKAAAILEAWFPGIQGGNGVADVLFGDVPPSGRLTVTVPDSVGQVPFYYNHYNTGRPGFGEYRGNYADGPTVPLYPFGYGLDYTTFEFGQVKVSDSTIRINGRFTAQVKVKNTGSRAGTAVAELYIRARAGSAGPRPVRELKGFQKLKLQPGETGTAEFKLSSNDLGYYTSNGKWLVEPETFQLWISRDSASGEPADFQLVR
jgi:beta-glucosidase